MKVHDAIDLARAMAATERHAGDSAGARVLDAFATLLRARLERDDTEKIVIAVCRKCGGAMTMPHEE